MQLYEPFDEEREPPVEINWDELMYDDESGDDESGEEDEGGNPISNNQNTSNPNTGDPHSDASEDSSADVEDYIAHDRRLSANNHRRVREWLQKPTSAADRIARRFYYVMRFGPIPCSDKFHDIRARQLGCCFSRYEDRCTSGMHARLNRTCPKARNLSKHRPLADEPKIGLKNHNVNPDTSLGREVLPGADELAQRFSGFLLSEPDYTKPGEQPRKGQTPRICLAKDQDLSNRLLNVEYDVDSHVQILPGLASFKGMIRYFGMPQPTKLLKKNIHIYVKGLEKDDKTPIHKIPHMYFGESGQWQFTLHFPAYYQGKKTTPYMTNEQHKVIFNIVREAMTEAAPASNSNFPINSEVNTQLSQSRQASSAGNPSLVRGGALYQSLNPDCYAHIDSTLKSNEAIEGLNLEHCFFLLHAKNTKTAYGGHRDHKSMMESYWGNGQITCETDERQASYQCIDVAAQWDPSNEPITVLVRKCCLRNTLHFLYGSVDESLKGREDHLGDSGQPGDDEHHHFETYYHGKLQKLVKKGAHAEYPVHHLDDVCSITSEPYGSSDLSKAGVKYFQSYPSSKNMLSPSGHRVFEDNKGIYLGYDNDTYLSVAKKLKGIPSDRKRAEETYVAHKKQCDLGIKGMRAAPSKAQRGPWRFEMRITSSFNERLKKAEEDWMCAFPDHDRNGPKLFTDAFYCIQTHKYLEFLENNLNQYCEVLDAIRCLQNNRGSYFTALLFATVYTCLRSFISPLNPKYQGRLNNPIEPKANQEGQTPITGLHFSHTMKAYGFAFLPPSIVDWDRLEINPDFAEHFKLPNFGRFEKKKNQKLKDDELQIWIERFMSKLRELVKKYRKCTDEVVLGDLVSNAISVIHRGLFRQYRQAMVPKMFKKYYGPDNVWSHKLREMVDDDQIVFTKRGFQGLAAYGIPLEAFNFMDASNRAKWSNPEELIRWIWDVQPSPYGSAPVPKVGDAAYATTFKLLKEWVYELHLPTFDVERFIDHFFNNFACNFSAIPYPDPTTGTLVSTRKRDGKRQIYCFMQGTGRRKDNLDWDKGGKFDNMQIENPPLSTKLMDRCINYLETELKRESQTSTTNS